MDGLIDLTEDDVSAIAKVGIESNLMCTTVKVIFLQSSWDTFKI